ncbi:NUDIX domain-containing protein [Frankia sp. Cpl3]|uniref:NUDIX hydrolase n=1 Tax=Parafrankia colletiae TaxID=573497 RepID=UPI0009FE0707|nr:NUDIX domain-containing protein [Parafrankia colletiae]MCK9903556.1 NUDIX domain-containing protein [Frankia sp. Cpl3]
MTGPTGVRHATASVFLLRRPVPGGPWALGLIRHPRFERWMLPGGHVEPAENPAQAALRELAEETGHSATLAAPPHRLPLPWGFGAGGEASMAMPWWIVEEPVPADRHPAPHIHVDHLYVCVVGVDAPRDPEEGRPALRWFVAEDLGGLDMFDGTRRLAGDVLTRSSGGQLDVAGDTLSGQGSRRDRTRRFWTPLGRVAR